MSWLAKRFAVLFLIFAIIIVLVVGVFANVWWLTIIKRMAFAGLTFMLLGLILGEYLHYNLKQAQEFEYTEDSAGIEAESKQEINDKDKKDNNAKENSDKMMPIDFEEVDSDADNVINQKIGDVDNLEDLNELGEEIDSEKVTDILRNMKENN